MVFFAKPDALWPTTAPAVVKACLASINSLLFNDRANEDESSGYQPTPHKSPSQNARKKEKDRKAFRDDYEYHTTHHLYL
jgi:hypothetical protein